ncbi:hypothetical protein ACI2LF_24685 [Kribbella sp. NPDC020789]
MRRVLSWVFVRAPAAFYEFADGNGGSTLFMVVTLAALALIGGLGAGIGAVVGLLTGAVVGDAVFTGAMIGLGVLFAWVIWSLILVAILWIRGLAPAAAAAGKPSGGRHAAPLMGWRRPGEPLVPGSLVAFLALMTTAATVGSLYFWYDSRPLPSPTVVADGKVIEEREPAWYSKGDGSVIIQYDAPGGTRSFESGRDPGDHFLRLGDVVPVEYSAQHPSNGRSTWMVEDARENTTILRISALSCAGLGVISAAAWVVGRRRARKRRNLSDVTRLD